MLNDNHNTGSKKQSETKNTGITNLEVEKIGFIDTT